MVRQFRMQVEFYSLANIDHHILYTGGSSLIWFLNDAAAAVCSYSIPIGTWRGGANGLFPPFPLCLLVRSVFWQRVFMMFHVETNQLFLIFNI